MSVRIPLPHFVPKVEALACRHAVSFAVDLGLQEIIFEGDSAIINQAITSGMSSPALYGHIVDDVFHLTLQLRSHKFSQVPRCCNKVADAFAKKARDGLDFKVWVDDIPGDIIPLTLFDVS